MSVEQNPIQKLFSFFDPQANRQRLQEAGIYGPRNSPQQVSAPQTIQPTQQPQQMAAPANYRLPEGKREYNVDTTRQIIDKYTAAGYSPEFAAGKAANAHIESGGNPMAYNAGEGALGLFQHRLDRLDNLRKYAHNAGLDVKSVEAQIDFSLHEYQTFEKLAYDKIMGTDPKTAGEYAAAIDKYYERSDGKARQQRSRVAENIYNDFFGGSPQTTSTDVASNALTYGPNVRPMGQTDRTSVPVNDLQRSSLPLDMGSSGTPADFMQPYSLSKLEDAPDAVYDDAILRFIRTAVPDFEKPEEKTTDAAADYSKMIGGAPLSMSDTGASTPAVVSAKAGEAATEAAKEPTKKGAVERFLDTIYGTKDDEEMSADERSDRKRAVGLALSAGFASLSNGSDANYEGIVAQRMELQQVRRANTALKKNAQGVSDMLASAGFGDRAQLPFMGKEGMDAAMSILGSIPSQGSAEFSLPSGYRATLAQTLLDSGQPELAEGIMTLQGDALKTIYDGVTGKMVDPDKPEKAGVAPMTPEQVAGAQALIAKNAPDAAALLPFMDDETRNKTMLKYANVGADVATAGQTAAATNAVDQQANADSGKALAASYRDRGMDDEASAVDAALANGGGYKEGKDAVATLNERRKMAQEIDATKARGAALADLIPDDQPELKAFARSALTSEDLNNVFEKLAPETKLNEERLYELAENDPAFLSFLRKYNLAKSGVDVGLQFSERALNLEMEAAVKSNLDTAGQRAALRTHMATVRDIVNTEGFESGLVQASVKMPIQRVLDSLMGDAAPDILNDNSMTGLKIINTMQNANFPIMGQLLKGAFSDRESKAMMDTLPSTGDTKTQLLAMAQYHSAIIDIQQAEYNAMLEWSRKTAGTAEAGDRASLYKYIDEQTKGMEVFKAIPVERGQKLTDVLTTRMKNGELKPDQVIRIVEPGGKTKFVVVPRF